MGTANFQFFATNRRFPQGLPPINGIDFVDPIAISKAYSQCRVAGPTASRTSRSLSWRDQPGGSPYRSIKRPSTLVLWGSAGAEGVGIAAPARLSGLLRPPSPAQDESPDNAEMIPSHVGPGRVSMWHKSLEKLRAQGMGRQEPHEQPAPG